MTTRAGVALLVAAGSLAAGLATGGDLFFNMAYLWLGALIVAWVWSRISLRGLRLHRRPRGLVSQVGLVLEETLVLENRSPFPKLWVEVRDQSDLPGRWASARTLGFGVGRWARGAEEEFQGHRASGVAVGLGPRQEWIWSARTICTRRGRYHLGPAEMHSADPFGFFPVHAWASGSQAVVVLPMTVPLPSFPLPSGRITGGESLRRRTYQVTPNAAGVRDHAPGDGLNRIHWPSTAKRERLIVKEFELDPMADAWLILDGNARAHYQRVGEVSSWPDAAQLPASTEEYMVAAAASIARYILRRNRSLGLVAYGRSRHVIQADRGEAQLTRVMESLAVFQAEGSADLTDVLKIEAPWIARGSTLVLLTPGTRPDLLTQAGELRRRGLLVVLVLVEPKTFGGPLSGEGLARASERAGFPVCVLRCNEPLAPALSQAGPPTRYPVAA
ncbi:MAG TPA: DUF58 domain-containing protein [Anaerolineales bacterium]|nr:DUF58 domain-containing protein [Anaerolineales bacterium]